MSDYQHELRKAIRLGFFAIGILAVALVLNVWRVAIGKGTWLTGVAIGAQLSALISCSYVVWRARSHLR